MAPQSEFRIPQLSYAPYWPNGLRCRCWQTESAKPNSSPSAGQIVYRILLPFLKTLSLRCTEVEESGLKPAQCASDNLLSPFTLPPSLSHRFGPQRRSENLRIASERPKMVRHFSSDAARRPKVLRPECRVIPGISILPEYVRGLPICGRGIQWPLFSSFDFAQNMRKDFL